MSIIQPPNPLARPGRRSTAPVVPKLRDTCDACAASKVKCDKKKPTCSRCAKRGVICEYVVTKRSGRKHESRQSDPAIITQSSSASSSTTNSSSLLASIQPSPRLRVISDDIENLPSMLSPGDPTSWWMPSDLRPEFNELFDSPITFQTAKHPKSGRELHFPQSGSEDINIPPNLNDTAALNSKDMSVTMEDILESPILLSESQSDALGFQDAHSDEACCCLLRALGLFKRSLRNSSTACMCSKGHETGHLICQIPTVQVVFAENEETIAAISNMLQCPCPHDGYLLVIIGLIVFKILGWYKAAARATSEEEEVPEEIEKRRSSCHSERVRQCPPVVDSYCVDGEDHDRIAAQKVLSELHRMQKLVNDLSGQLKAVENQDQTRGIDTVSPFSSAMLNQLDIDLRTRLRVLYLEIVDLATRIIY
ncbi:hypothetical protein PISL3812_03689 [Talaromyces islandicus]|uniref:Zn(2)-C6 fungal-type domain-containing protein n=1 Tax=Talaromyces islandicus TaxID=28573 RepID=A0A0U1LTE2_TALIS|nr:hypothetical protein PISL3812_03689 [Talaromyces islandicus]